MKKALYRALRAANVKESLAMKVAADIPDDIATRAELKLASAESENRSEKALASFETSNAKSLADFKLATEKAINNFQEKVNESQIKLMWRFLGFQTALTGIIASIFVAAMKLL